LIYEDKLFLENFMLIPYIYNKMSLLLLTRYHTCFFFPSFHFHFGNSPLNNIIYLIKKTRRDNHFTMRSRENKRGEMINYFQQILASWQSKRGTWRSVHSGCSHSLAKPCHTHTNNGSVNYKNQMLFFTPTLSDHSIHAVSIDVK